MHDLQAQKKDLRKEMRQRQAEAYAQNPGVPILLRDRFLEAISLPSSCIVATIVAQGNEPSFSRLNEALLSAGHFLCLPVVHGPGQPLVFRAWVPGEKLVAGAFDIPEPEVSSPIMNPSIVLVPFLAFDRKLNRLGRGGGYYDRTIALLRSRGKVSAIGLGFAAQEVESVPAGPEDQRLDIIVTEKKVFRAV